MGIWKRSRHERCLEMQGEAARSHRAKARPGSREGTARDRPWQAAEAQRRVEGGWRDVVLGRILK